AFAVTDPGLHAQAMPLGERAEVRDHLEPRLAIWIIDGGEIGQHFHAGLGAGLQELSDVTPARRLNHDGVIPKLGVTLQDCVRKLLSDLLNDSLTHAASGILTATACCAA